MGPEECDFKENILHYECLRGNPCPWQPPHDAGRGLCCGAVAHDLMGARCGCGLGASEGAQAPILMERGSEAQPRGCWAGWWLRAEMLLSGFLSEQEM